MISEECTEEIEVLSAIYGLDLVKRTSAWNLPSFTLRLKPTPLPDGSSYVSIDLFFTLPKLYPKVPPNYEIEAVKGLTEKCLDELKEKLTQEAMSRTGQVMCYELATVVTDHLELYNKRPQSLFESMTSRYQREGDVLRRLRSDSNSLNDPGTYLCKTTLMKTTCPVLNSEVERLSYISQIERMMISVK